MCNFVDGTTLFSSGYNVEYDCMSSIVTIFWNFMLTNVTSWLQDTKTRQCGRHYDLSGNYSKITQFNYRLRINKHDLQRSISEAMFYERTSSQKINKLHKWALMIARDAYCSSFEELLDKDSSITVHYVISEHWLLKCLRYLMGYHLHSFIHIFIS